MNYEIVGLMGTAFVLVCFLFDDPKRIRIFDGIGALLFVIYGVLIGSLSNIVLNSILIVIQIYKLVKMGGKTDGKPTELDSTST